MLMVFTMRQQVAWRWRRTGRSSWWGQPGRRMRPPLGPTPWQQLGFRRTEHLGRTSRCLKAPRAKLLGVTAGSAGFLAVGFTEDRADHKLPEGLIWTSRDGLAWGISARVKASRIVAVTANEGGFVATGQLVRNARRLVVSSCRLYGLVAIMGVTRKDKITRDQNARSPRG